MTFVRIALFLITFTLEVRVKAAEAIARLTEAQEVVSQPDGCIAEKSACAIATRKGQKFSLDLAGTTVVLDQDSAVVRLSSNELRLLRGSVLLKAKHAVKVSCEYGSIQVVAQGEAWITKTALRIQVLALQGSALLNPLGVSDPIQVPTAMTNWIGAVDVDGKAQTGIPTGVALEPALKDWARVFPGSRAEFEKQARAYYESWQAAVESAAALHKALFDRKVASLEQDHERKQAARKKVEERDRYFREMFRRKVFEE